MNSSCGNQCLDDAGPPARQKGLVRVHFVRGVDDTVSPASFFQCFRDMLLPALDIFLLLFVPTSQAGSILLAGAAPLVYTTTTSGCKFLSPTICAPTSISKSPSTTSTTLVSGVNRQDPRGTCRIPQE